MRYRLIWIGLIVAILCGCSSTDAPPKSNDNEDAVSVQPSSRDRGEQSKSNPILGTWRLIPGQAGGEYWPKPCREIKFTQRASFCGDTGSPNSYDIQRDQVTVYDNHFEQVYRFPDSNTMTTSVAGVGTLRFERIN